MGWWIRDRPRIFRSRDTLGVGGQPHPQSCRSRCNQRRFRECLDIDRRERHIYRDLSTTEEQGTRFRRRPFAPSWSGSTTPQILEGSVPARLDDGAQCHRRNVRCTAPWLSEKALGPSSPPGLQPLAFVPASVRLRRSSKTDHRPLLQSESHTGTIHMAYLHVPDESCCSVGRASTATSWRKDSLWRDCRV
jgi:hypothetical protein